MAGANLFAVALVIATTTEARRDPLPTDAGAMCATIVVLGVIPSLVGGAMLGWLAARLEVRRATVLVGIALAAVASVAALTEKRWLVPAELPTIVAMLCLERWTRGAPDAAPPPVRPVVCGALLAIATLAAIAVVVGIAHQHELELLDSGGPYPPSWGYKGFRLAMAVFIFGAPFAAAAGAGFGVLAARFAKTPPVARCGMLGAPVVAIVAGIGDLADRHELVLPALGPALVAVLVLERVTRWRPALAPARAIQHR